MNEQSTRMCVNVQTGFGARHIDRFSRSISMRLYSVLSTVFVTGKGSSYHIGGWLQGPGLSPGSRFLALYQTLTEPAE